MPSQTSVYQLTLYSPSGDQSETFINFRDDLAGDVSSNMTKIEDALVNHDNQIEELYNTRGLIRVIANYVSANYFEATTTEITEYDLDMGIILSLSQTNTGTVTLNINSLGTKSLMKYNPSGILTNLTAGDLRVGQQYIFAFNGTVFVWVSASSMDQINAIGTMGNLVQMSSNVLADSTVKATDAANAIVYAKTGWMPAPSGQTWTYLSGTTFRVTGDFAYQFPRGTKLKITQGSLTLFYYAVDATYSSPYTTVTTVGDTILNATILNPHYSYADNPQDFPGWFSYSPDWTCSSAPSIGDGSLVGRFCINGKMVTTAVSLSIGSTTNTGSGQWFFSLPAAPGSFSSLYVGSWRANDAGVANYGGSVLTASSSRMTLVNNGSTYVQSNAPATWGNGDTIVATLNYPL
jgi:hypothetical protein